MHFGMPSRNNAESLVVSQGKLWIAYVVSSTYRGMHRWTLKNISHQMKHSQRALISRLIGLLEDTDSLLLYSLSFLPGDDAIEVAIEFRFRMQWGKTLLRTDTTTARLLACLPACRLLHLPSPDWLHVPPAPHRQAGSPQYASMAVPQSLQGAEIQAAQRCKRPHEPANGIPFAESSLSLGKASADVTLNKIRRYRDRPVGGRGRHTTQERRRRRQWQQAGPTPPATTATLSVDQHLRSAVGARGHVGLCAYIYRFADNVRISLVVAFFPRWLR